MNSSLHRALRPLLWGLLTAFGLAFAWTAGAVPMRQASRHPHTVARVERRLTTHVVAAQSVASAGTVQAARAAGLRAQAAPAAGSPPTAIPLYTFPGQPGGRRPLARLIQAEDEDFYGVTQGGGSADTGTVFRIRPSGTLTVLDSFGKNSTSGQYPAGPLVEGLNADGTPAGYFLGTTAQGGDSGAGTIYLLAPDAGSTTGYSISYLYSFTGGSDGGTPQGGLTVGRNADGTPDGYVYGMTAHGGNGSGVVFRMTTNGFVESRLYTFPLLGDGYINQGGGAPRDALLQSHTATVWGDFFGTTSAGGSAGQGTVFRMTAAGVVTTIHDFQQDTDGQFPLAGLTQNSDGSLFGTTNDGGAQAMGTVYRLVADSSSAGGYAYSQVVSLDSDNAGPTDSLIQASDGKMYGTGSFGGSTSAGSVFRVNADSSSSTGYTATAVFTITQAATQGSSLTAGVTQGIDGDLYGATSANGSAGAGTIYRLNLGLPVGGSPAPQITSAGYQVVFHAGSKATSTITVNGSGFVDTPGANVTNVRSGTGLTVTFVSDTQVVLNLDNTLPSGTHGVTVTNADGQSASITLTTYDGPQITPPVSFHYSGPSASTLIVDGTSFVRGGTLTVSNTSGTSIVVGLNGTPNPVGTEYTADFTGLVPAGDHLITITNPDGLFTSTTFTTYGRPEITVANYHLNPSTNTSTVTVSGNHFVRGGQFTIGNTFTGTTIDATINNAPNPEGYQIAAQLNKPLPTGDHLITVTNPDGQKATYTFTTYAETGPNITHLQSIARTDGSSDLLITGTGFVHAPSVSVTNITTGTGLGVTADSTTSITVHLSKVLPLGTHDVKVTNPDGQSAQATLITYGKPRIDGATAITQTGGEVRMVVSGVDFYPGGYNGDISGATVIIRDPSGAVVPSRILAGPGVPANIGDPQQITLSLGSARNGQNYSVEVDNSDGQTSRAGALAVRAFAAGQARPEAQSAGSARFNVYTSNQTQYHASFFESLLAFFHLQFLLNPSGNASPTQLLPGDVSLIDQHPSLLVPTGPGSIIVGLVAQGGGNLVAQGGGNVISNDGGSLVAQGGGNLITQDGGGLVAQGGGNLITQDGGGLVDKNGDPVVSNDGSSFTVPITGLVAPVGAAAGIGGKLDVTTLVAQGGGNARSGSRRPGDSQNQTEVSFSLTKFDQGAENGTGPTEAQVYGQDADGNDILILSIRFTPDKPDVVTYKAPGLGLTTSNGTSDPLVENPVPTLATVSPTAVVAGTGSFTLSVTGTLFEDGMAITWNGQPLATTVLSGTQATAQVPAALIAAAGTAQVTVTNPAPGGGASNALPFTIIAAPPVTVPVPPKVLHTYPAGLQMFSAPEDFTGVSNAAALGGPAKIAVWDPALLQYALSPAPPADALHLGQGYWARFKSDTPLYDLGGLADTTAPFAVALRPGWNMVGDPFLTPVPLTDVRVQDDAGHVYTLTAAGLAGIVSGTLYGFPAGATAYQALSSAGGALAPYQGYWVHAFRPCTLLVSPTPFRR